MRVVTRVIVVMVVTEVTVLTIGTVVTLVTLVTVMKKKISKNVKMKKIIVIKKVNFFVLKNIWDGEKM